MRLTYKDITRHIIRCFLSEPVKVVVSAGPDVRTQSIFWDCTKFNMSATIACYATLSYTTIATVDRGSAVIEWRDGKPVKTSGDLEIEINKMA